MTPLRGGLLTGTVFLVAAFALSGVLPLWLDEILQLAETRSVSPTAMIASLPQFSGAAPLGYLVQQASLKITGYSVRMARVPSVLFGAGAVFLTALLAAELGLKYSWQAAALFAAFPLTLRYGTESRVYSMALFLSVLASFLYVRLAKKPSWILAGAYWLTLIAAAYTQPYSVCVGFAHLLWAAVYRERGTALAVGGG